MNYDEFIKTKLVKHKPSGFQCNNLPDILFDFQHDIVKWAVWLGKAAIFTSTGSGKTIMLLTYAQKVYEKTNKNCIIVSPLGVSLQTIQEAKDKLNLKVNWLKHNPMQKGLNIINYESLHRIDPDDYDCVVLDESSILKSYSGKIRNQIIDMFSNYSYKLCTTATPSPNDYVELGNHSEFLDVMKRKEMLAMFFIHDGGETSKWRLKKHGEAKFWEWLASWGVIMNNPLELGYKKDLSLPELKIKDVIVDSSYKFEDGFFSVPARSLQERRIARKETLSEKVEILAEKINNSNDIHLVWCDLNIESEMAKKAINNAVEIKGSDKEDHKEKAIQNFVQGKIKCLVTKASMFGFGLNLQICHNMHFLGMSDSFETYYQAMRRCWRFGQKNQVNVYRYISNLETAVLKNIQEKEERHNELVAKLQENTRLYLRENLQHRNLIKKTYKPDQIVKLPEWLKGV